MGQSAFQAIATAAAAPSSTPLIVLLLKPAYVHDADTANNERNGGHRNQQDVEDMHGSATCSQNIRRILNPKITGRIPANILTSVGGQRSDLMSLKRSIVSLERAPCR
jgi:hypothetical protein